MSTNRQIEAGIPAARFNDLVVTEATNEVLVYDSVAHHIHKLNVTTAAVWRLCDGINDISDIGRLASLELGTSVDVAMVRLALTQLADADLLIGTLPGDYRVSRMTRRTFMQRSAVAGAVAVPAVVSISAPAAGQGWSDTTCSVLCAGNPGICQQGLADCPYCVTVGGQLVCDDVLPPTCGQACGHSGDCQGPHTDPTVKCNVCFVAGSSPPDDCTGGECGGPQGPDNGICWHQNNLGSVPSSPFRMASFAGVQSATDNLESAESPGTLIVTLIDESGNGVAGTTLQLLGETNYSAAELGTGTVTFSDITPGSYSLQLLAAPGGATADAQQIEIVAGDNYAELILTAVSVEEEEPVVPTQEPTQVPPTQAPPTPEPTSPPPPTPEPTSPPPPTPEPTTESIVETNSDTDEGDQTETNPEG